ncbi:hypothetical protein SEA_KARDASHIAN_46 [Streptomyces phage Kardashian]|nr:hypothetical protein SEA_KARDASHIAN_46 [Streptomyces phage Kardashian]
MSNSAKTTTATVADVVDEAKKEKLVTEVPAQGNSDEKATGEKAKEVVEETAESAKKTVKDRMSALVAAAKKNRQFFLGVVTGAVSTAVVMVVAAKEKVEEIVEVTVVEEPATDESEDTSDNA